MAYLDNSSITVDAILTKKGRELLARGRDEFKITQYAFADDEVDYRLWNPDHPLGTAYYGISIENTPITEASPDETQVMKYKLITLPRATARVPRVDVGITSVTLNAGQTQIFTPTTLNIVDGDSIFGYTAVLSDSDGGVLRVVRSIGSTGTTSRLSGGSTSAIDPTVPVFIGDLESAQSVAVTGDQFEFRAATLLTDKTVTITFIGNETGGSTSVQVTIVGSSAATTITSTTTL